jgi:hypothetical protein
VSLKFRVIDKIDAFMHRLGWCPRWLCDYFDYLITGEKL